MLTRLHQSKWPLTLRWRHNDHAGVSNHQPHGCLLNRLFRRKSKKTSKLHVTGLCAGNSPGTGEFPTQMASYAENVSIWWRQHEILQNLLTLWTSSVFFCAHYAQTNFVTNVDQVLQHRYVITLYGYNVVIINYEGFLGTAVPSHHHEYPPCCFSILFLWRTSHQCLWLMYPWSPNNPMSWVPDFYQFNRNQYTKSECANSLPTLNGQRTTAYTHRKVIRVGC